MQFSNSCLYSAREGKNDVGDLGVIVRLALLMLVVLTVVFVSLYFYLRAGRREALLAEWMARDPSEAANEHRDDWINRRLDAAMRQTAWRLAILVYAVPLAGLFLYVGFTDPFVP